VGKETYFFGVLSGDYDDSLHDAKAAVELQPTYIKAIARGKVCYKEQSCFSKEESGDDISDIL